MAPNPRDLALGLAGPVRPPETHTAPMHTLGSLLVTETVAGWRCSCGDGGRTSRAYVGEDLAAKARRNHYAHARRRARGVNAR